MRIQVDTINLRQGNETRLMQAFRTSFNKRIGIVVTTAYYDGDFFCGSNQFHKILYFVINRIHCMPVCFQFLFLALRILINEKLNIAKIKMPHEQNLIAQQEVVALYVEK